MSARNLTLLFAVTFPLVSPSAQERATSFTALDDTEIVDQTGASIGTLRDVVVGGDGHVVQILIGSGGALGIGEKLRAMNVDTLPIIADDKIRMDGVSADSIASLPEYKEAQPPAQADSGSPPVSGANQQAPQSASTDIPVAPSAVTPPPAAPAPTPVPAPTTVASADASQVESPVSAKSPAPAQSEESSTGSGSSGMAPQQGTGTGATQVSPTANEGGGQDKGGAPGASGGLNAQYGRESTPENQKMPEGSSGRATTDAKAPEASATPDAVQTKGPAANSDATKARWRIGEIVDATVHADRDGLTVKDVLFSGDVAETVVIARTGQRDLNVPFASLDMDGTADDPELALSADLGARP